MKYFILFANKFELHQFIKHKSLDICSKEIKERSGNNVLFVETGIGKENVENTLRNLSIGRDDILINIGFAGALDSNCKVGEVFFIRNCQISNNSENKFVLDKFSIVDSLQEATVLTTDKVIFLVEEKKKLKSLTGCSLVDMELAHIVSFCMNLKVKCYSYKVVSDNAQDELPDFNQCFDEKMRLKKSKLAGFAIKNPILMTKIKKNTEIAQKSMNDLIEMLLNAMILNL